MRDLDIIVPVKNEEKNIAKMVAGIKSALDPLNIDYKILFGVDKSTDNTLKEIHKIKDQNQILLHEKQGKPGKGYTLLECISVSDAKLIAFIDGDLQYSPKYLPEMYAKMQDETIGVVVANRKVFKAPLLRRILSRLGVFVFGRLLAGINTDIQSGLKIFRKSIGIEIDKSLVTPWTFDIPLLFAAQELGYKIDKVDIEFEAREEGASKVGILKTGFDIAKCAFKTRFKNRRVYNIESGVIYRKKKYVTHTNRHHSKSAIYTFQRWQKIIIVSGILALGYGLYTNYMYTLIGLIAFLTAIYFADVIFSVFVISKSLYFPPELAFSDAQLASINDKTLPVYTILCPLYKESEVLPHFIEAINNIDWPKNKLDVILLLEEDDAKTIHVAQSMSLPDYFRIVVTPHSAPKTKPKACNYGLLQAKGEYIVIYDAEDKTEPMQLKKAYLAFTQLGEKTVCVQAKLNYYNPHHNLLTRLFTAEYSLWFDVVLPGLQSIDTYIPLGGTSNHFKTQKLRELEGWDPFNVTEDCDLGVRLFKEGYKTAIIDSVTLEEANSNTKNWIRQRSRWLKGYMQTYQVHMRDPINFFRTNGAHALLFQLIIGLRIIFILINPIWWAMTISYFVLYKYVGPTIESFYPTTVFYMGAISLVFGNFLYLYNYMIGLAKRGHWELMKYVFLVPFYWFLMSIAAVMAFYQLLFKPHHWEKTQHGLHLKKAANQVPAKIGG